MARIRNQDLVEAGLRAMQSNGRPLKRIETGTRSMQYSLPDGKTVRIRTCNDPVLVVLADSAEPNAKLNIEGTDFLLVAMPVKPRTPGPVHVYLVPTTTAVREVRHAHSEWLKSNPKTKGNNRTWNLWFGEGPPGCSGFDTKWQKYRLEFKSTEAVASAEQATLGRVIASARQEIARAAGVPIDAVRISVVLE